MLAGDCCCEIPYYLAIDVVLYCVTGRMTSHPEAVMVVFRRVDFGSAAPRPAFDQMAVVEQASSAVLPSKGRGFRAPPHAFPIANKTRGGPQTLRGTSAAKPDSVIVYGNRIYYLM